MFSESITPEEMGKLAADEFQALISTKPACVLGLATGSTPLPLYRDYFLSQAMNEEFYPTHGELDPEVWEAEAVYRLQQNGQPQNVYVICWEGRIVSLHIRLETENPELTAEQIATIVEKLKP